MTRDVRPLFCERCLTPSRSDNLFVALNNMLRKRDPEKVPPTPPTPPSFPPLPLSHHPLLSHPSYSAPPPPLFLLLCS